MGPYSSPNYCGASTERLIPSVEAAHLRLYSMSNNGRMAGKIEVFGCLADPYVLQLPQIHFLPHQVSSTKLGNYYNADHLVTSITLEWGTSLTYDGTTYAPGYRSRQSQKTIVTFEVPHHVHAVVTAGGSGYFVKEYQLYYAQGELDLSSITSINSKQTGNVTFLGNQEDKQWIRQDLQSPVIAKHMVFQPTKYSSTTIFRLAFLGFPVGE
jgi:hypothetical protein